MALNRIMIAAVTVALAQSVAPTGAVPITGVSRIKTEVQAKAGPVQRLPGTVGRRAVPPLAFVRFCNREKAQCEVQPGRLAMRNGLVIATPAVLSSLISVNTKVNDSIRHHSDSPKQDVWTADVDEGDCEDYVLTKRARLLADGWPSSALSIAVVYTRNGEGHAVLVAHTDAGEFVLDNLRSEMLPREKTGYRFVSMQDGSRPLGWVAL